MATPLKQVCQRATSTTSRVAARSRKQHTQTTQWQPLRSFSSAPSRPARSQQQAEPALDDTDEIPLNLDLEDLPSIALQELETHRELRALARRAAWEMPLLSSLSKPFVPPTRDQPLRWRYTSYLGEQHPASRKVVLEFSPLDLSGLTEKQRTKLCKLAGPRYNPETQVVKMSCESFETQAQNKRYLGEVLGRLLEEAKDPNADAFEDVPLDTRHVKQKKLKGLRFPDSWKMTAERKAELEAKRKASADAIAGPEGQPEIAAVPSGMSADEAKMLESLERAVAGVEGEVKEEGQKAEKAPVEQEAQPVPSRRAVVSGLAAIEAARKINLKKVEEPIMAEARQPIPSGKMGKKQMGQNRVQR